MNGAIALMICVLVPTAMAFVLGHLAGRWHMWLRDMPAKVPPLGAADGVTIGALTKRRPMPVAGKRTLR